MTIVRNHPDTLYLAETLKTKTKQEEMYQPSPLPPSRPTPFHLSTPFQANVENLPTHL